MNLQDAFGHKGLQTFPFVTDAPLPVLGCLSTADELELVGGEPLAAVADGGALAPLAKLVHVEQRSVVAALHLYARLTVVQEGLEVGRRREALQSQLVRGQRQRPVRPGQAQHSMQPKPSLERSLSQEKGKLAGITPNPERRFSIWELEGSSGTIESNLDLKKSPLSIPLEKWSSSLS